MGTMESFDVLVYKYNLALQLSSLSQGQVNTAPSDISVALSAASVRAGTIIAVDSLQAAQTTVSSIRHLDLEKLLPAGFAVETFSPPTIRSGHMVWRPPSAMSSVFLAKEQENDLKLGITVAVPVAALSLALCIATAVGIMLIRQHQRVVRQLKTNHQENTTRLDRQSLQQ